MTRAPRPQPDLTWSRDRERSGRSFSFKLSTDPEFAPGPAGGQDSALAAASFDAELAEFTARWQHGEAPDLDDHLGRLRPDRPEQRVELIYRAYRLAESAGLDPSPAEYLERFPDDAPALERLFALHTVLRSSRLRLWPGPTDDPGLPVPGDEIGPYRLIRELGQGGFARVFLAEQSDLDDRLVVVKVSTRVTTEPMLLARAGHPHIVEVFWHGLVDGGALQVLCMPFLGGATLAAVLSERRRQGKARPSLGRDLLDELDRVSAPEHPSPGEARPARQLLERLSYPRAAAWVVARLAEALDFAFGRGVLHGDVKPSNVLLTSEGVPMLLDFNLAVGWRPRDGGPEEAADDAGGTLAYMAPERLQALADPFESPRPSASDRHRADVYALGIVLLELLTGRPPELPGTGGRPVSLKELASAYVVSRRQGGSVMIRAARAPVSGGLRAILERCLAPDPSHRYRRARDLAEDLDRWLEDRPLLHSSDPSRRHALARWVRRRRVALAAAVAGLVISAAAGAALWNASEKARVNREMAEAGYMQIVGSRESGAFLLRRQHSNFVVTHGDPAGLSRRHLERYGVLNPGDWRQRHDVRGLPAFERAELEVFILEHALRFADALADRGQHQRALDCLRRAGEGLRLAPIEAESRSLRRKLGLPDPPVANRREMPPVPWMEAYLSGVEAELRVDPIDALACYRSALTQRPGSFWASYRAAATAFTLQRYADAVRYLRVCVEQRPDSQILRHQYAGCLLAQGLYQEASDQYEKSEGLDPEYAETYLSRSYLRLQLGQLDSLQNDIRQYETLKGWRVRTPAGPRPLGLTPSGLGGWPANNGQTPVRSVTLNPDELEVHIDLGQKLAGAGRHEMALEEFELVLANDPDQIKARLGRALSLLELRRDPDDIDREFSLVVEHPRVEELVSVHPPAVYVFHRTVSVQISKGQFEDALRTARKGLSYSERFRLSKADADRGLRGRSHYSLALACISAAEGSEALRNEAREHLKIARGLAPVFVASSLPDNPLLRALAAEPPLRAAG
jgi:serine/threonine protein kinase